MAKYTLEDVQAMPWPVELITDLMMHQNINSNEVMTEIIKSNEKSINALETEIKEVSHENEKLIV